MNELKADTWDQIGIWVITAASLLPLIPYAISGLGA
jgi:hypothetical protein